MSACGSILVRGMPTLLLTRGLGTSIVHHHCIYYTISINTEVVREVTCNIA